MHKNLLKSQSVKFKSHPHGVFGVWHLLKHYLKIAPTAQSDVMFARKGKHRSKNEKAVRWTAFVFGCVYSI
jgi:hypothetical protein